MAIERTLSIIKPDAVAKNVIGQIYARFEAAGLKVVAARMAHLSRLEAEQFYAVHKERPFLQGSGGFHDLRSQMIQALEGENAILKNRELMGATDPKKAEPGTIRADLLTASMQTLCTALTPLKPHKAEVAFFFPGEHLLPLRWRSPCLIPLQWGFTPWGQLRAVSRKAAAMTTNLLEFDLDALIAFASGWVKTFPRNAAFRWIHQRGAKDFGAMSDLAKSLRKSSRAAPVLRRCQLSANTSLQTAPSSGFLMWATAMRWSLCSFQKMIGAPCVFLRRQAVPSAAVFARRVTRDSVVI